jgi:hypothetical protein
MIKGAKGESIEEPSDLDKELMLLEGKLRNRGKTIEVIKSKDTILQLIEDSIKPLFYEFLKAAKKFDNFYVNTEVISKVTGSLYVHYPEFEDENLTRLKSEINSTSPDEDFQKIQLSYKHLYFNREGFNNFNHTTSIYINLGKTKYKIKGEYIPTGSTVIYEKLYSENLTEIEVQTLISDLSKSHLEFIESKIENKD